MAKKESEEKKQFYSYLLVDSRVRRQLFLRCLLSLVGLALLVNYGIAMNKPWLMVALTSVLIGLPVMALPLSEKWAYQPWQADSQKVEAQYRSLL